VSFASQAGHGFFWGKSAAFLEAAAVLPLQRACGLKSISSAIWITKNKIIASLFVSGRGHKIGLPGRGENCSSHHTLWLLLHKTRKQHLFCR
jgi:hypothetical protein